ncbi:unnamed protein product [Sphacelaria rigidula]
MIVLRSVYMVRQTPMRQCVTRGCRWKWRDQKMKHLIVGCHPCARESVHFWPRNLSRMQLTLHATRRAHHGTSRLVIECEPGPAKTCRAPCRLRRNARSMVISTPPSPVPPGESVVSGLKSQENKQAISTPVHA